MSILILISAPRISCAKWDQEGQNAAVLQQIIVNAHANGGAPSLELVALGCSSILVSAKIGQSFPKSSQRLNARGVRTIVVPVDFSTCSREGLQCAIGFANEFGARIILLHATYLGYIYSSEGTALYEIPGLQEAARKNA